MRWLLVALAGLCFCFASCDGDDDSDDRVAITGGPALSPLLTATASATTVESPCPSVDPPIYRANVATGEVATIARGQHPRLSRDGTLMSYLTLGGPNCGPATFIDDVDTGEHLFNWKGIFLSLEWSPTSPTLALGGNGNQPSEVTIVSIRPDGTATANTVFRGLVNGISWSGDGSRVAYINGATGEIGVYDLALGTTMTLPSLQPSVSGAVAHIEWSPTADRVAVWAYEFTSSEPNVSHLFLMSPIDGSTTEIIDPPGGALPSWSPDGSFLSFSVAEGETNTEYIAAVDGSSSSRSFPGATGVWTPDGTLLAYVRSCENWDLSVVAPDGKGDRVLVPAAPDQVQIPWSWSPDSSLLAYSDKEHTYTVSRDGSRMTQLGAHMEQVVWSPDGRYLIGQEVAGHGIC